MGSSECANPLYIKNDINARPKRSKIHNFIDESMGGVQGSMAKTAEIEFTSERLSPMAKKMV
jgi:hypothetical protein